MNQLARITLNPKVMGGKPCIRGLRVTVDAIVGLTASGHSAAEILRLYPYLDEEDLREALAYHLLRTEALSVSTTALASEQSLAEDWNRPEEDEAWSHLQQVR